MDSNNSNLITVLIVDNNKIFRDGLALNLNHIPYVDRIYHAENIEDALSELKNNYCDLIFIDHYLPFLDGALSTHNIKLSYPHTKVICITTYDDEGSINNMFNNGVDGYLLKNTNKTEIEIAIINVIKGKHYFSKDIPTAIINKILENINSYPIGKLKDINKREKEILNLIYEEYTSKEIANKLFISERTVEFYRHTLIKKTGSKNIVGLIKYAIANMLIKPFN